MNTLKHTTKMIGLPTFLRHKLKLLSKCFVFKVRQYISFQHSQVRAEDSDLDRDSDQGLDQDLDPDLDHAVDVDDFAVVILSAMQGDVIEEAGDFLAAGQFDVVAEGHLDLSVEEEDQVLFRTLRYRIYSGCCFVNVSALNLLLGLSNINGGYQLYKIFSCRCCLTKLKCAHVQ